MSACRFPDHSSFSIDFGQTEDDGPTFVRKPVIHETLFQHLFPKNWSFL